MKPLRHLGCGLLALVVTGFASCGVPGIPKPPSLNLPQPVTDLRAVRKGSTVNLSWTIPTETTDLLPVRHMGPTRICRSANSEIKDCTIPVGEVAPPQITASATRKNKSVKSIARTQEHFTDALPSTFLSQNSSAQVLYAVSVMNENGRSAGLSNVVRVPAVLALPPPSDFRPQVTSDGIVLNWDAVPQAADTAELRHVNRIYRRDEASNADTVVGEVPLDTTMIVDHSFEWEKTYSYRATVVTIIHVEGKSENQFEGDDSPAAKVFAHDVFPPAVPTGLQAVFSGVGQQPFIDLIWAPDVDADLAGYNIYRHEANGEPRKINTEPVKTPAFRDTDVSSGHTYFYSVSAVDIRGNESARSSEASERIP